MCGFLGVAGKNNISEDLFLNAFDKIKHRGPDESIIFTDINKETWTMCPESLKKKNYQ